MTERQQSSSFRALARECTRRDNALVESLRRKLGTGYEIRYQRMPNEGDLSYAEWSVAIRSGLTALRNDPDEYAWPNIHRITALRR